MKIIGTLALLACASIASATIVFEEGNIPQTDENILFSGTGTDPSGNPVIGVGNQTDFLFQFNSSETLTAPSSGQARVEGDDGSFTDINLSMVNPLFGFTSAIFNINAAESGSVTIDVDWFSPSTSGTSSDSFDIDGNGENFFTITSVDGQVIQSINLTTTADVDDLRQIRIGSAVALPPGGDPTGEIPEPMSMGLLGGGLSAFILLRKKIQKF